LNTGHKACDNNYDKPLGMAVEQLASLKE